MAKFRKLSFNYKLNIKWFQNSKQKSMTKNKDNNLFSGAPPSCSLFRFQLIELIEAKMRDQSLDE